MVLFLQTIQLTLILSVNDLFNRTLVEIKGHRMQSHLMVIIFILQLTGSLLYFFDVSDRVI